MLITTAPNSNGHHNHSDIIVDKHSEEHYNTVVAYWLVLLLFDYVFTALLYGPLVTHCQSGYGPHW